MGFLKMKLTVLGLLILGLSYVRTETSDEKQGKVFSLFSVVTFPNSQCTAKSDTTEYGTCYTASECTSLGGTTDGNCAAGFGVCCTFSTSTCGTGITQNCTYISNPSYPTTYTTAGSCSHAITPVNSDICQMRLDFTNFDITETTAGVCTDSFAMTGPSGQNPLNLCGTLTNQHIYFENARSTATSTVTFTIVTGGTWKIKISQIECYNLSRAYPDCDQYVTGVTGTIASYNWHGSVQLRAKDYQHCIRREAGYCGIQYSQVLPYTSPDSYDLDDTATYAYNGHPGTGIQGYITLPGCRGNNGGCYYTGGVLADGYAATQAKGNHYPAAVITANHMFRIEHTQLNVAQTSMEGFKLQFVQLPCSGLAAYDRTTGFENF